eukprot:TRINITY_DN1141_c0_g1_i1.p1 TRINITY_DN1141_c0_g1~~TRINITY_DN1141_c0_g1_i1.p1  ORF type:complete len:362 (+),score=70.42 TRINITY_DN1141_c0_g1_i1:34-1086(+)
MSCHLLPYSTKLDALSEKYQVGGLLGRGGFSNVYHAVERESGRAVALKVMPKSLLTGRRRHIVTREIKVLERCHHPSVLKLHQIVETPTEMCVVLDLVQGGDLFDFVDRHNKNQQLLPEDAAVAIARSLFEAVEYLHSLSPAVVHQDIKPENILVEDGPAGRIKLSDFGLARILGEDCPSTPTPGGTALYLPPEVIEAIDRGTKAQTDRELKAFDMWSIGVVLYILICGRQPFRGKVETAADRRNLLWQINRGVRFPMDISPSAKDLIVKLLQKDPNRRLTAAEALEHVWLQPLVPDCEKEGAPAEPAEPSNNNILPGNNTLPEKMQQRDDDNNNVNEDRSATEGCIMET